jgi:7 transmembrane receptor (rhodopsin family)
MTFFPHFVLYSSGMIVSSTLVSMLSVLLVAIDRFLYILYGMQYQQYIFPNRARILIATTWIIGELLAARVSGELPTADELLSETFTTRITISAEVD